MKSMMGIISRGAIMSAVDCIGESTVVFESINRSSFFVFLIACDHRDIVSPNIPCMVRF
jgi:hypothetical protein